MARNATRDQVADSRAVPEAARIRELMLANLFAVGPPAFNMGVPEQPPAVSGVDVALVRDGRIAVLHTLLTAEG